MLQGLKIKREGTKKTPQLLSLFPDESKFWLVCLANLIYGEGLGVGMEGRSWKELRCL